MDQLIRIQNEKQIALQNRTTIQVIGEKSQVSETVLAFWEAYQWWTYKIWSKELQNSLLFNALKSFVFCWLN